MTKFQSIRAELKQLAQTIKATKPNYRSAQRERNWDNVWKLGYELDSSRLQFRIKHIAFCLLRGTPLEKIETRRPENEAFYRYNIAGPVEKQLKQWQEEIANEQALRASSQGSL